MPNPTPRFEKIRAELAPHIARVGQAELSRQTGIPQPNISAWLRGDRGCPQGLDGASKLADACGLELVVSLRKRRGVSAVGGVS